MPHSSGGGSHGGGCHSSHRSHSGGSHRGGSSGSSVAAVSKPLVLSHPKRGYTRYAHYRKGKIEYEYIKDKPDKMTAVLCYLIIYIPIMLSGIMILFSNMRTLHPLNAKSYDSTVVIEDNIDVMTPKEETELTQVFERFRDKTGITCSVITAYNSDWQTDYNAMENYAYDLYVNHWTDENHWLFVYSESEGFDGSGFNDWYWEGMQGNNTDNILTSDIIHHFNDQLQKYLTMNSYSVAGAFGTAIDEMTDCIKVEGTVFDPATVVFVIAYEWIVIMVMGFSYIPVAVRAKKDKEKIRLLKEDGVPVSEHPLEDTCAYCGGVYIHGVHLECPHCGAAITPMKAGGNV